MVGELNLIKLCVGIDTVDHLAEHIAFRMMQREAAGKSLETEHVTRMWPKRSEELLAGGSLYWVIKGKVQVRQTILRLQERIGEDGIRRCAICLDPALVLTSMQPRRPFQGWRYLTGPDAPVDLGLYAPGEEALPQELQSALADIGVY